MMSKTTRYWWRQVPGDVWFALALGLIYVVGFVVIALMNGVQ